MTAFGCQSMVAPLRRVIVKRPAQAFGNPENIAAQWRELAYTAPPDFKKAEEEHKRFSEILREHGAEVLYLPADNRTWLDSLYTHDPAIVTEKGAVIFQTGKLARRGEGPALAEALKSWDVPVLGIVDGNATAEGGDMLWLDRHTVLAGRGYRTNAPGIRRIRSLMEPLGVNVIEVPLPYWTGPDECLHLMSLISLLDQDLAVVYRKLLPVPLLELFQERNIQLIDIPEEEYATQACNILALAPRDLLMLRGNPVTRSRLEAARCKIAEFDGEEISLKGGGGPTCLTRPLLRA